MTPIDPSRTLARQVRVPGIARCERVRTGPATLFGRGVQAPPSVDRRGNSARPEITSQLAAPTGRLTVFCARHAFTPSIPRLGPRARMRATSPARSIRLRRGHRGGGVTPYRAAPAPRSKPIAHASRLVTHCAPSVASGRGVKIRAAGPAHLRLYSQLSICVRGPQKVWRTFRGDRRTPLFADGADAHRAFALPAARFSSTRIRGGRDSHRREYGVKHGGRGHSCAGQAAGSSSRLRRRGHRTRRDPRRGRGLYVGHCVDHEPRGTARGQGFSCFNTRSARIASQRRGRRATAAAAPLRARGWDSELSLGDGRASYVWVVGC